MTERQMEGDSSTDERPAINRVSNDVDVDVAAPGAAALAVTLDRDDVR